MSTPEFSAWTPFEATYRRNLSVERLRKYKKTSDRGQWHRMIGRYLYNVEVAARLYPALHWSELVLRNHLNDVMTQLFPVPGKVAAVSVPCWLDTALLRRPEHDRVIDAKSSFQRRNPPPRNKSHPPAKQMTPGHLVAELSFGFWTSLLDGRYQNWRDGGIQLWPKLLDEGAFPHCPALERVRKPIHTRFIQIKELRNRALHHERIVHQVAEPEYDQILDAIHWIDPAKADHIRGTERKKFVEILKAGPQPFIEWAASRVI